VTVRTRRPTLVSVAYALWLGFRGRGWGWLLAAAVFALGWATNLHTHFLGARRGSIRLSLLRAAGELLALAGTSALWFKLVVGGGLAGGIAAVMGGPDFFGLALAIAALVIGWYYSKQLGALFYFDRVALRPPVPDDGDPQAPNAGAEPASAA
jgi:hypothetical protein